MNFLYRTQELQHIFSDSGARAFIGHSDHLDFAGPVLDGMPQIDIRCVAGPAAEGYLPLAEVAEEQGPYPPHPARDDDTWAIIYTSGTTGLPKGAMLTHRNLANNAMTIAKMRHTDPKVTSLGMLPLFHILRPDLQPKRLGVFGHHPAPVGSTSTRKRPSRPSRRWTTTILIAVPTIYNRLAEMGIKRPPNVLRCITASVAGLRCRWRVIKRFEAAYHATIYEGYGLTECSPVCVEKPLRQGHQARLHRPAHPRLPGAGG